MAGNMTLAGNSEFKSWVSQLKKDIRHAQVKAAIKVNTELLRLYWRMGADICEKQKSASWGDGWLKELSRELMAEFRAMKVHIKSVWEKNEESLLVVSYFPHLG